MEKYCALLRGINVGGKHKVPMAELKILLEKQGFENVSTLLNSGNVIFNDKAIDAKNSVKASEIESILTKNFGFPIPTILVKSEVISEILENKIFSKELKERAATDRNFHLYVTFLSDSIAIGSIDADSCPRENKEGAFKILEINDTYVLSQLDLTKSDSTKAMNMLENNLGKNITTRNLNTVMKIHEKMSKM